MKYEGKLSALQHFQDGHYAVAELEFRMEGEVLSVPSLPFIMLRLDQPHGRIDNEGWRFESGGVRYVIPRSELALIFEKYSTATKREQNERELERFYDVYDIN